MKETSAEEVTPGENAIPIFHANNPKGHTITTSSVFYQFREHFLTPNNNNILFSGKYGSGKSYFLNGFTSQPWVDERYYFTTISPVNYVVSTNEDIFDLIKVDIIKSLYIDGKIDILTEATKIPTYEAVLAYAKKKPVQLVKNISSCLSQISVTANTLNKISTAVMCLLTDFEKFESDLNPKGVDHNLGKFLGDFFQNKASYVESNIITEMIIGRLTRLKDEEKRENVLIIEDLDRLDPAHIFRILNILSAHQVDDTTNKFGFDKIILVCDIDNIEKIYKHFYGQNTEFEGYINKFFSFEPFHFDNREAVAQHLKNVLSVQLHPGALIILVNLISRFIQDKKLSLRKVLQVNYIPDVGHGNFVYKIMDDGEFGRVKKQIRFILTPNVVISKNDMPPLRLIRILKCLFGSYDELQNVFKIEQGRNYSITTEDQKSLYELFAINRLIMNSHGDTTKLFFRPGDHAQRHPVARVANVDFIFHHKWNASELYDGQGSFFEGVHIESVIQGQRLEDIDRNFIFSQLSESLTYYQREKML